MSINAITKCRECGSESLTWEIQSKTDSGVPEGRLRSNEVKCLFVLGCDYCSETLAIISADRVAVLLNAARAPAELPHKPSRRELLKVVSELQDLIGEAVVAHANDRAPDAFVKVQAPFEQAFALCIQARSFDPLTNC